MADAMPRLNDQFGRHISYVRLSLTDRCDMRCRYCMAEDMIFLPRAEILSLEEIYILAAKFVDRGVTRIRLTGGEPLARRGAVDVATKIGTLLGRGLDELTLTTNATRLAEYADGLRSAGIERINISLDTRDPDKFRDITRTGDLARVLGGDASFEGGSQRDGSLRFTGQGMATVEALRRAPELGAVAKFAQAASGQAAYRLQLGFVQGQTEFSVTTRIR